eukprot:TRINITY_DN291_c0_g1_i1.p1 TRINITY_DN291_c0_g1~~TRINITY_DN291_c0_g1_i1.p1  ORF type:complete len:170 (-),score=31.73 TRINITY_DN291_c0_g1_i1:48-557(-)
MSGLTNQIRTYSDNATEKEVNDRKTSQNWGLFENNSHRTRGITTEQSLQELEAFNRNGQLPGLSSSGVTMTTDSDGRYMEFTVQGSSSSGSFRPTGTANNGGSSGGSGGMFTSTSTTTSFTTINNGGNGQNPQAQKLQGQDTNKGAQFFAMMKEKEAAKYRPGNQAFRG